MDYERLVEPVHPAPDEALKSAYPEVFRDALRTRCLEHFDEGRIQSLNTAMLIGALTP